MDQSSPALWGRLIAGATALPGVLEGLSQVSPASSRALFIDVVETKCPETSLAPSAGRLEAVHLHGVSDASVHLRLPEVRTEEVIAAGWGEVHPHGQWRSEIMVYGPRDEDELGTVLALIQESLEWARDLNY